ncbi:hypothetical protein FIBSPDRAFT_955387 [Athelia psychrophila]|uniref:Uncharacterized protein n=1 Tax=Athelia psychrophila TaxID=1759441 RepID=A0A166I3M0_9AGAM|nr:hypothetical protein FIBSPDRAFT_955387 [Fibularhizoctonia sp. CBS 109695]
MSNFSQSDCNHHGQSNKPPQLLSPTPSNLENSTQPHSSRPPAHHEGSRIYGDGDWSDSSSSIGVFGLEPEITPIMLFVNQPRFRYIVKEAELPTSVATTSSVTPFPTSWLKRFCGLFQSIKVEVKAKKTFHAAPAPDRPRPPVTFLAFHRVNFYERLELRRVQELCNAVEQLHGVVFYAVCNAYP